MKNLRTKLSYALYILLTCVFISCGNQTTKKTSTNNVKQKDSAITKKPSGRVYRLNITTDRFDVKDRLRIY